MLRAEEELDITAGLQDRVVQVYGGVVYMDFAKKLMQQHGHGRCCLSLKSDFPVLYDPKIPLLEQAGFSDMRAPQMSDQHLVKSGSTEM